MGIKFVGSHVGEDLVKLFQGGNFPFHFVILELFVPGFVVGIGTDDFEGDGMIEEAFEEARVGVVAAGPELPKLVGEPFVQITSGDGGDFVVSTVRPSFQ